MKIRSEVNILNTPLTASAGATKLSTETVTLDYSKYNGTVTYYFEIVVSTSTSLTNTVTLRTGGTDDATCSIPLGTTTNTLIRSAAFTAGAGAFNYNVFINAGVGGSTTVKAARIIVIENVIQLTDVETQIDIGNKESVTSSTLAALASPKYFKYTAANWDQIVTAYWEVMFSSESSKITATAELQVADGTGDGFTGWSAVGLDQTTSSGTPVLFRSSSLTLTAGRNYRVVFKTSNSKSAITIYGAKMIIDSAYTQGTVKDNNTNTSPSDKVLGGSGTNEALAQSFTAGSSYSLSSIIIGCNNIGTPPTTDGLTLELRSGSQTGTLLASCTNYVGYILASGAGPHIPTFPFSSPISIVSGTKYWIVLTRTGSRDTNKYFQWFKSSSSVLANGEASIRSSGSWSDQTYDYNFQCVSGDSFITLLEAQYLLANTKLAAGTGLQTFLTKWDSTEWSGVTNTYKYAVDAANNSTSIVEVDTAAGTQVTGSVVTSPDNQGISSAMTMPADGNLDMKATTNNGDVYGSRILVAVTPTPSVVTVPTPTSQGIVTSGVTFTDSLTF